MSLIDRADKKARTVSLGRQGSSRPTAGYYQISHWDREHWLEKGKNIPGNQADNDREENWHATEIIPRETLIRRLFWVGLVNCSSAGKCPAIAQCRWVDFWGDFRAEFLPLRQPEAQPPGVINAFLCVGWSSCPRELFRCNERSDVLQLISAADPTLQER